MTKDIKININKGQEVFSLDMNGDLTNVEDTIVSKFFEVIKGSKVKEVDKEIPKKELKKTNIIKPSKVEKDPVKGEEEVESINLEKLKTHFDEGEHIKEEKKEFLTDKERVESMIQDRRFVRVNDDGRYSVATSYDCPDCGNKGKRFSYLTNSYTTCHECRAKIKIQPIISLGSGVYLNSVELPVPDEDGFFFDAYNFYY